MRADHSLQSAVLLQLDYDPVIDSSHIGVAVRDGVATLTGHVPSVLERTAAEKAAGRVKGVRAVINQIVVDVPGDCQTSDEVVAQLAAERLSSNALVPRERIQLVVRDGCITLHGDVDWHFQRLAAVEDLERLACVKAVDSHIEVRPMVPAEAVQRRIHNALVAISPVDAERINVVAAGTEVTLSGEVTSWHEKDLAETAAWSVPGVSKVNNRIEVI
jgi:osmotically-inducible protein OsmY